MASQSFHLFRHGSKLKGKKQLKWFFSDRCQYIGNFRRTLWHTSKMGNVLNKTRHSNPIIYKDRRRKIFVSTRGPLLRGKGNELIEKRGKTNLEKKCMWRISGKLLKGTYQAILKIWTHGNSPDTGSIMGQPCKTNSNGFSTRYNKFYGANSYVQCVKLGKEITGAEQSDRTQFCFSSKGLQV